MFHGTMTLYKDKNELSTKTPYYYDRDYRENASLKNQNLKIKNTTDLLVTWPPSWITVVQRGLISQASQALSFWFSILFPSLFLFNAQGPTRTASKSKNAQRKRNTQGQVSTASTTTQHPKNVLNTGSLHYAIKWSKKIMRNVSRLLYWFYTSTTDTTQ